MKATREDFENFLEDVKKTITDKDIGCTQMFDFKDYTEFVPELKQFLENNSQQEWEILTNFGIGIERK